MLAGVDDQVSATSHYARTLSEMPAGLLEAYAIAAQDAWAFVDAATLRKMGTVPSRLFGKVTTDDWSAYFDGVVVVRNEVAPVVETRR